MWNLGLGFPILEYLLMHSILGGVFSTIWWDYFVTFRKRKHAHWENVSDRNASICLSLFVYNGLCRRTQDSWARLWRGTQADQIWYLGLGLLNEAPIAAFLFIPVLALLFQKAITWFPVQFQRCYCLSVRRCARVSRHRFRAGYDWGFSLRESAVKLMALQQPNRKTLTSQQWNVVTGSNQPGFNELEKRQTALKWFGPVSIVWTDC